MNNERISSNDITTIGPGRASGRRILAADEYVSNDTWVTQLNNNDLIVGTPGSGKTRNYVKPNLLQMKESVIVTDTKGSLLDEVGPVLRKHGYHIQSLDFSNMESSCGYNPLASVQVDPDTHRPSGKDIMSIAKVLCPIENSRDPFWDYAAQMELSAIIGYVVQCLPHGEHTLGKVAELVGEMGSGLFQKLIDELEEIDPASFAVKKYRMFEYNNAAEKMQASIIGIMAEKLDPFTFDSAEDMFCREPRIDFTSLAHEKTAVFLTVSDTDRSQDRLVNLFYTQAIQALCDHADNECAGHTLPIPVRMYLDDFATNCRILDFDKTISVIRSRNIAVSVILQSMTQLTELYGEAAAMTVVNGCDHMLYLGGRDIDTANYVSIMANRPIDRIVSMPRDRAYIVESGSVARLVKKYDLKQHERYHELPEAAAGREGFEAGRELLDPEAV